MTYIGISGWNYDGWKGRFYPEGLARSRWLGYASSAFSSIEVNATFYREMRESTYAKWRASTPEGFVWAVKAHRYITHTLRGTPGASWNCFRHRIDSVAPVSALLRQ